MTEIDDGNDEAAIRTIFRWYVLATEQSSRLICWDER